MCRIVLSAEDVWTYFQLENQQNLVVLDVNSIMCVGFRSGSYLMLRFRSPPSSAFVFSLHFILLPHIHLLKTASRNFTKFTVLNLCCWQNLAPTSTRPTFVRKRMWTVNQWRRVQFSAAKRRFIFNFLWPKYLCYVFDMFYCGAVAKKTQESPTFLLRNALLFWKGQNSAN